MTLLKDLRYGARKLVRNPGFAAVSVVTLALGIGLTTTMFSIVYGALMRGLPFDHGERVVALHRANPARGWERMPVTLHDFADYRAQARSFEGLSLLGSGTMNVSGAEKPERFNGAWLSANAFRLLRAKPFLGRTFRPGEDEPGAPAVVVLGYDLWQSRFGGDRGVVGKTIRVNAEEAEVIGVMPPRFAFPVNEQLWMPVRDRLPAQRGAGADYSAFGRLRPGVSVGRANVEVAGIARRLAAQYPESNAGITAAVEEFTHSYIGHEPVLMLETMLYAVFLVLLIACANVANLLLGQAAMRAKEVAVRTAVGATRARIVAQFLTEPLALASAGAVLGVGLAAVGVGFFNRAIAASEPPFWIDIRIDGPILLFVLGITLFATLVSGVLPALRVSGGDVNEVLKDESRGSSGLRGGRLSKVLVVFEIALSVGLLVAAGLTTKSITRLRRMDYGFPTATIFTARVGLPEQVYRDSASQVRFYTELYRRLGEIPGAASYTLANALPALGAPYGAFAVEGKAYARDVDYPLTHSISTFPGYFSTFSVSVRGRDFGTGDTETSEPVAIVSRTFATKFFGAADPIGRRIRLGDAKSTAPWRTIVGVVPDMWNDGSDNKTPESVYVPFAQAPERFVSIVVRPRGASPASLTGPVRAAVTSIDPDLPIYFVKTLQERIDLNTWFYRVFGTLFMVMGLVALVLAGVGLYGVMSFNVARRTREMGVRMALGARAGDVLRLVLRQGMLQLGVGLALGSVLALALSRGLRMILFQVSWWDPVVIGTTFAVLALAALAATLVPARRATRVDPIEALRYE